MGEHMDFANRTVIVTGGTGALGIAVVGALLDAGAQCRVPYLIDAEVDSFPHRDRVTLVPRCDLTDESDVDRLYDGVSDLWASIHLAGGFGMGDLADTDKDGLMRMLNMNLVSCYLCCRRALAAFGREGGRIVNVAARAALEPRQGAGTTAYTVSKAGVSALTQALAAEVVQQNVLVNAVAPAVIDTPANRAAMPRADHQRWPSPAEIAATVGFLAAPDNEVTTGGVVPVYGRA